MFLCPCDPIRMSWCTHVSVFNAACHTRVFLYICPHVCGCFHTLVRIAICLCMSLPTQVFLYTGQNYNLSLDVKSRLPVPMSSSTHVLVYACTQTLFFARRRRTQPASRADRPVSPRRPAKPPTTSATCTCAHVRMCMCAGVQLYLCTGVPASTFN